MVVAAVLGARREVAQGRCGSWWWLWSSGVPFGPFIGGQGGGDGSGAVAGGASSEGGVNGVGRVLRSGYIAGVV